MKRNSRSNERSRSLSERFVGFLFTTVASGAVLAGSFIVRNPVVSGGATALLVVMGFVSANALWYQPQSHDNLFFRTRPELVFVPTPKQGFLSSSVQNNDANPADSSNSASVATPDKAPENGERQVASLGDVVLTDTLPALAPNADLELAKIQQKLFSLGLYNGAVDGLSGPRTRQAIEQWQLLQQKSGVSAQQKKTNENTAPVSQQTIENIIQVAVPETRPDGPVAKPVDKVVRVNVAPKRETTTAQAVLQSDNKRGSEVVKASLPAKSQPVTSQDIVRVQAGLKAFGNDLIIVDGVAGQSTQDAVREFQKLFDMKITGQVDAQLIGKMREIGLIS